MYKEIFIKNLKNLFKEHKINLNILSKAINVPYNTLYYYLNGTREVKIETLCKIADFFDISLDELCGREKY